MPANDVTAIQPELWSAMVQVPLYKRLVALEVANTKLSDTVKHADTIHVPYFSDLSAKDYTPGSNITATNQDWKYDSLVVSAYKYVCFYVDDPRALTVNVDQARELAGEAAYQLSQKIDRDVFKNITGDDGFKSYGVDAESLQGGTAHRNVSAGSADIIQIFANARKVLRDNDVEETGDWCAIVSPKVAAAIEIKAANVGYNVADATLRNGYAGDFMGFEVYVSRNLPTGECSTISTTVSAGVASGNCMSMYWGRKNTMDVVLMKQPALEVRPYATKLGSNFVTWQVYGSAVFTKNRSRGLNVAVHPSYK